MGQTLRDLSRGQALQEDDVKFFLIKNIKLKHFDCNFKMILRLLSDQLHYRKNPRYICVCMAVQLSYLFYF